MIFWQFMDYHSGPRNVFLEWLNSQAPAVRAACDYAIKEAAVTADLEQSPFYKQLTKRHAGLCEIKFKADDSTGTGVRQFRALGFWNYDRCNFILVSGGRKPILDIVFQDVLGRQEQFFRYGTGSIYEHLL